MYCRLLNFLRRIKFRGKLVIYISGLNTANKKGIMDYYYRKMDLKMKILIKLDLKVKIK